MRDLRGKSRCRGVCRPKGLIGEVQPRKPAATAGGSRVRPGLFRVSPPAGPSRPDDVTRQAQALVHPLGDVAQLFLAAAADLGVAQPS